MSARHDPMKSGPVVPIVCWASFAVAIVIAIVAPLAAAGVVPFAVTP